MTTRRRKIALDNEGSYNSDTQIDYTFDEESENPFIPRPRISKSPILTRSRAAALLTQPGDIMEDNNASRNIPGGSGHHSNPETVGSSFNIEDLSSRLERVLTLNHTVFMNELTSLKQALVGNINRNSTGTSSPQNAVNQASNNNQNIRNESFHNRSLNSDSGGSLTSTSSCRVEKWNIIYDGSQDVSDFLFKIDTLKSRWNCSSEQVVASFHTLLRGKAESWFWSYLRQNTNTTYDQLKLAIMKQFGQSENECDKIVRMIERRQLPKEPFDDYFMEMIGMNSRLSQPMNDNKMVDLIKNNVKESLGTLLFSYDLFSLEHLRDAARKAEKFLAKQHQLKVQKRFVSEIEQSMGEENEEQQYEVAAIQHRQNTRKEVDTSHYKCWNCDQVGHSFYDCPLEKRNLFCFRCGEKNVSTPQCKKHQKNRYMNE